MSRYSPESDVLVTVDAGAEVPGRAAGIGRLVAGREAGLAGTLIFLVPLAGLTAACGLTSAAGLAADMVFAAAVSALEAMVMALVAAFIACRAVDIVLADEVALVAAAVILVAAEVTFAAAEETVLAAATVVGTVLAAAGLALTRLLGLAATLGLLVARRIAPVRMVRARAVLAEPRRTAVRAVDCRGIDLPPIVINYGGPIPRLAATYTPAALEKTLTGQLRGLAATAETIIDGKRCKRRRQFSFVAGRP